MLDRLHRRDGQEMDVGHEGLIKPGRSESTVNVAQGLGSGLVEGLLFANTCQIRDLLNEVVYLKAAAGLLNSA
jgi:hypothetical protein